MITQLSQDTITQYASDAQTIQEPQGADYSQGVAVGKTIPAKWWNWLFSAVTKRMGQSKTDAQNMLTELQNTVTDAGLTLDASDNTQLSQAVSAKADIQIAEYIRDKKKLVALWQILEPKGLLPVPAPEANIRKKWVLDVQKAGNMFWSVHGIIRDNVITNKQIAFSKNLEEWHIVDPADIDNRLYATGKGMTVSITFFKGTYYMCLTIGDSYVSSESTFAILSSQDTETWNVDVLFTQTGGNYAGVIFSAYNKIMCAIGKRFYTSSDGANWTYTNLSNDIRPANGAVTSDALLNYSVSPEPLNEKYIVGDVLVEENALTPLLDATAYKSCFDTKTYKLRQGNIVLSSGNTVDSSFNVSPIFVDMSYNRVLGTLRNGEFLITLRDIGTNPRFEYSTDGINFSALTAPLYADVSVPNTYSMPVCELDGKFYYSAKNGFNIFESEDLVHWTDTGNTATSAKDILSLESLGVIVSDSSYSYDKGYTWLQAKNSDGNNFCGHSISAVLGDKYFTTELARILYNSNQNYYTEYTALLYTGNYINRVIGHTLYLQ